MASDLPLVELFAAERPRLLGVAHRLLGSSVEAEEVVQEAWIRLAGADVEIENLGGWLTTVVSRLCLDRLRARRSRPESPVADPAASGDHRPFVDEPADAVELADAVSGALAVVVGALAPAERVAFVLHDVFAVPFDEVAAVLQRSPVATRQLASRARRRVRSEDRSVVDLRSHRAVVEAFLHAARSGDVGALAAVLAPGVALRPDAASTRMGGFVALDGREAVAARFAGAASGARLVLADGLLALAWAPGGTVRGVIRPVVRDGLVVAIEVLGEPERIEALELVAVDPLT